MQECDLKPAWKALLPVCGAGKVAKQSRRRAAHALTAENGSAADVARTKEHYRHSPKRSFNETIEKLLHRTEDQAEIGPSKAKQPAPAVDFSDGRATLDSPKSENGPSTLLAPIPKVAPLHHYNAPVHLDVGGKTYTTTLETLTRHAGSHLANLFSGNTAVVLDYLKQNYFIDRDGKMFRHVLNYLRTGLLLLPKDFQESTLLLQEAQFYGLDEMVALIKRLNDSTPAKRS